MQPVLDGLLIMALGLGIVSIVRGFLRAPQFSGRGRGASDAGLSRDSGRKDPVIPAAADGDSGTRRQSWNPNSDPFRARHRRREDDTVTYRAGSTGKPEDAPAWDPYAHEQSRVHRVRQARHKVRTVLMPDYYKMLDVERNASDAQISRAYKRRAAVLHPDKFYDDPERRAQAERELKELNAAMEVLRSPTRRAQYDAKL